jgi:hypothetical protein
LSKLRQWPPISGKPCTGRSVLSGTSRPSLVGDQVYSLPSMLGRRATRAATELVTAPRSVFRGIESRRSAQVERGGSITASARSPRRPLADRLRPRGAAAPVSLGRFSAVPLGEPRTEVRCRAVLVPRRRLARSRRRRPRPSGHKRGLGRRRSLPLWVGPSGPITSLRATTTEVTGDIDSQLTGMTDTTGSASSSFRPCGWRSCRVDWKSG